MAEAVVLRARDGREVSATAEVKRVSASQRTARAAGLAIGGVVLGAASIAVPGVHFVAPWLLPILGFGMAAYFYRSTAVVGLVRGTCPECQADIETEGGPLGNDPLWIRCPSCQLPLLFVER